MLTISTKYTNTQNCIRMDAMLALVLQPNRESLIRFVRNYNKIKLMSLQGLLSDDDKDELRELVCDYIGDLILEQEKEEFLVDNRELISELEETLEKLTNYA